jgi:SPP1 gp7 family putative phage head morphogenesis protein
MKKKHPPLTKKTQRMIGETKPPILKGEILNFNYAVEQRYYKEIERLVIQMTKQTKTQIKKLFNQEYVKEFYAADADIASQSRILTNKLENTFNSLFGRKAKAMCEKMVTNADKASSSTLHASLASLSGGLSLPTKTITAEMSTIITASVNENVALIKSIPQQYFTQIKGIVMRSITTGNGLQDIIPELNKYEGVTIRRARNIALDQTRKVYSGLNSGRMKALGITEYEWIHSGGGQHPREDHIAMNGNIYRLDNPPIIDKKTGERGIPSQAINCKCTMRPVITFNEGTENAN